MKPVPFFSPVLFDFQWALFGVEVRKKERKNVGKEKKAFESKIYPQGRSPNRHARMNINNIIHSQKYSTLKVK